MIKESITFLGALGFMWATVMLVLPENKINDPVHVPQVEDIIDSEVDDLKATIQDQELLIYSLTEELEALQQEKAELIERARRQRELAYKKQDFAYRTRTGVTEWEEIQIKNWFDTYAGTSDKKLEEFREFLQALLAPNTYKAYVSYVGDLRDITRQQQAVGVMRDLICIPNLTDEQKDKLYEEAYLSTEDHPPFKPLVERFSDTLTQTLSENQLQVLTQYDNIK